MKNSKGEEILSEEMLDDEVRSLIKSGRISEAVNLIKSWATRSI